MLQRNVYALFLLVWVLLEFCLGCIFLVWRIEVPWLPIFGSLCVPLALFLLRRFLPQVDRPRHFSIYVGFVNSIAGLPYSMYGGFIFVASLGMARPDLKWLLATMVAAAVMLAPPFIWGLVGHAFATGMIRYYLQAPNRESTTSTDSNAPIALIFSVTAFLINVVLFLGLMNKSLFSSEGWPVGFVLVVWGAINLVNFGVLAIYARRRASVAIWSLLAAVLFIGCVGFMIWLVKMLSQFTLKGMR